jgi:hypothetical protein
VTRPLDKTCSCVTSFSWHFHSPHRLNNPHKSTAATLLLNNIHGSHQARKVVCCIERLTPARAPTPPAALLDRQDLAPGAAPRQSGGLEHPRPFVAAGSSRLCVGSMRSFVFLLYYLRPGGWWENGHRVCALIRCGPPCLPFDPGNTLPILLASGFDLWFVSPSHPHPVECFCLLFFLSFFCRHIHPPVRLSLNQSHLGTSRFG